MQTPSSSEQSGSDTDPSVNINHDQAQEQEQERPIVLILGLTGAGKTTFLNHLAETNFPVAVDDDMEACTATTQTAVAIVGGVEILLVDTPGFDDPDKSEARVLINVTEWIKNNLRGQHKVTAALYLHSIETTKMYGSNLRNFHLFANLIGGQSMKNVGLVTTHWDTVPNATALRREAQLSARPWSVYLQHGAQTYRTNNSRQSCRAIARQLLELQPTFLQIQEEMTRGKKALRDTEAGKHVIKVVEERIQDEKECIAELKKRAKDLAGEEKADTEKLIAEAEAKLETYMEDLKQVEHVSTWGESAVNLVKTQGPQLALNLATIALTRRGANIALAGAQSQIGMLLKDNAALKETVAAAAARGASNMVPNSFAIGTGFGTSYWGLEKTFEVVKWAVPKIIAGLPI